MFTSPSMLCMTSLERIETPSLCSTIETIEGSSIYVLRMTGVAFLPWTLSAGMMSRSKPELGMRKYCPVKFSTR